MLMTGRGIRKRFGTDTEFRAYHLTCGVDGSVFVQEMVENHSDGSLMLLGR